MSSTSFPARHWHKLQNGRIQCDLCPRACQLQEGQRGLCFGRARAGDWLYLTSYGLSSGLCLDRIEKKPLNHFLPGNCRFIAGDGRMQSGLQILPELGYQQVAPDRDFFMLGLLPRKIAVLAREQGAASVAFTYNDPVVFMEYALKRRCGMS